MNRRHSAVGDEVAVGGKGCRDFSQYLVSSMHASSLDRDLGFWSYAGTLTER